MVRVIVGLADAHHNRRVLKVDQPAELNDCVEKHNGDREDRCEAASQRLLRLAAVRQIKHKRFPKPIYLLEFVRENVQLRLWHSCCGYLIINKQSNLI